MGFNALLIVAYVIAVTTGHFAVRQRYRREAPRVDAIEMVLHSISYGANWSMLVVIAVTDGRVSGSFRCADGEEPCVATLMVTAACSFASAETARVVGPVMSRWTHPFVISLMTMTAILDGFVWAYSMMPAVTIMSVVRSASAFLSALYDIARA